MKYRIITHGNCTDGFCSAFIVKKYFNTLFNKSLSQEELKNIPIFGIHPRDIQLELFEFQKGDIVVDLPKPAGDFFFWCDHHETSKPKEESLSENELWRLVPSCTGLLIDLAKENGLKLNKEIKDFKQAIDVMDGALYTKEDIKLCYYEQDSNNLPLQKLHMINAIFFTRDRTLNDTLFETLLMDDLGTTPLSSKNIWQFRPDIFHKVQLEGFAKWRAQLDTYVKYDEESKTVVQDDRDSNKRRGVVDRFYVYMKFDNSSYAINIRVNREGGARIGIGTNIFHKDRGKVDIGELCHIVGTKFGDGVGGGHFGVGGSGVHEDKVDEAIKFILETLKTGVIVGT
jgi:hypothetical protein